jgi:hypothetical protein
MLREKCANAHSGKLTPKRRLRNLRLLAVVFFSQKFLMHGFSNSIVEKKAKKILIRIINVGKKQIFFP